MHFDFHAGKDQTGIGINCNPAVIEKLITEVKPDYVQCDTKGHVGATSYPTKVGNPAPQIKADILRMWRDITAKHNVALYAHYSGVWDDVALEKHPEWSAYNADGTRDVQKASVFGPYVDELLIPQMLEMALDYELDGAWIDGECWAVVVDYSDFAKKAYFEIHKSEPPLPDDEKFPEYLDFCRQGFRDYIDHYVTEIHKSAPDFQIASNWLYTSFVPEEPTIGVDFISGDYSPNDSLNTARFEARCIQNQGKPWDLMAWGFSTGDSMRCVKEYEQLCQEAAAVIMLGGGFQFYNKQIVGTVQEWAIPMWSELAKFCREREEACFKAEAIPQVGIVYSQKALYKERNGLFQYYQSQYGMDMRGLLYAVLDNQYSTEILMTHHILSSKNLDDYGVIILPNLETIETELKEKLLEYVDNGGNLIVAGCKSTRLFLPYLDVEIADGESDSTTIYLENRKKIAPLKTRYQTVSNTNAETIFGVFHANDDEIDAATAKSKIAATVTKYGKGKIAGVYFNLGAYDKTRTAVTRDFVGDLIATVFEPAVKISGSKLLEISLMQKNGCTDLNLLNLGGVHGEGRYKSFDERPPLDGIQIEIKHGKSPGAVKQLPENIDLPYTYEGGKVTINAEKIHIHSVIAIK
jgi:hypothetical protein